MSGPPPPPPQDSSSRRGVLGSRRLHPAASVPRRAGRLCGPIGSRRADDGGREGQSRSSRCGDVVFLLFFFSLYFIVLISVS